MDGSEWQLAKARRSAKFFRDQASKYVDQYNQEKAQEFSSIKQSRIDSMNDIDRFKYQNNPQLKN